MSDGCMWLVPLCIPRQATPFAPYAEPHHFRLAWQHLDTLHLPDTAPLRIPSGPVSHLYHVACTVASTTVRGRSLGSSAASADREAF
jgi:hypothetical protein